MIDPVFEIGIVLIAVLIGIAVLAAYFDRKFTTLTKKIDAVMQKIIAKE